MLHDRPSRIARKQNSLHIFHIETEVLSYLTSQLQMKKRKYPVADFWWDVYNWYVEGAEQKKRTPSAFKFTL